MKKLIDVKASFPINVLAIALFLSVSSAALASANVMVTPTRIVFEGRDRADQVTVVNNGDEAGTFRISFIRQQMTVDGDFEEVAEGGEGMFSDSLIRYSPRQVRLQPGESQVVRLMLRKPRNLPEGEYRSHLRFQTLPESKLSGITASTEGITVEIIPILGISIPVIVRHGTLSHNVVLENPRLLPADEKHDRPRLMVDMRRVGNSSAYGDFQVSFIGPNGRIDIGRVNGAEIYTPNDLRHFPINLNVTAGLRLKNGSIRVVYLESGKDESTGLIAEVSLSL